MSICIKEELSIEKKLKNITLSSNLRITAKMRNQNLIWDFRKRQYFLQAVCVSIMYCNAVCKKYIAKSNTLEGGRYKQGQKQCTECEVFISWEGLWCPCCGRLLRTKPRSRKLKNRLSLRRR